MAEFFGAESIADTAEQVAADWPFVGVLERQDDTSGLFRYVAECRTKNRLSVVCKSAGVPPHGTFRVHLDDGEEPQPFVIPAPPVAEAAPSAPVSDEAAPTMLGLINRLTAQNEAQEGQIIALRAARDEERAKFLDELADWRRLYDTLSLKYATLQQEKVGEITLLRTQYDGIVAALHQQVSDLTLKLAVAQAKDELLDALSDDDDAPPLALPPAPQPTSLLDTLGPILQHPAAQGLIQRFTGAPVSGDGHALAAAPDVVVAEPASLDDALPFSPATMVTQLVNAALEPLLADAPSLDADERWASQVAAWVRQQPSFDTTTLLSLLANLATEAVARAIPAARLADLTAVLVKALGYTDDVRDYVSAGPAGLMVVLKPALRRAGIELSTEAEAVLKSVLSLLKKQLR
ncbi:MAG: hypothetical protein LCH53_04505 [Bacteroidetes bacterium]|nr:hypothetical protein [Bacteroidota bacterium]